jgi:hypothetical protein
LDGVDVVVPVPKPSRPVVVDALVDDIVESVLESERL